MKKLSRSFYTRSSLLVAQDLLGKTLVRRIGKRALTGKIVEVEAYRGAKDPASHAYRGKTKRNEVMFGEGGFLYVYFTYGMHFCANVVTGDKDVGEAVLIRAVEPLEGIETMGRNRGFAKNSMNGVNLTNGPAKLCQAFGIRRNDNATDLLGDKIFLLDGKSISKSELGVSTRIGISRGKEKRWRFFVKGNRWVSR
ncbi:MAG: DNA-3-methyladenine glycosylase [Bacteroidota bacterium]